MVFRVFVARPTRGLMPKAVIMDVGDKGGTFAGDAMLEAVIDLLTGRQLLDLQQWLRNRANAYPGTIWASGGSSTEYHEALVVRVE